jgi:DNA-binding transcriptional LysR family regulator
MALPSSMRVLGVTPSMPPRPSLTPSTCNGAPVDSPRVGGGFADVEFSERARMTCPHCYDTRWVSEVHPERPWEGGPRACGCGAPSSLADNFYAPLAAYFMKDFPRVRLELSEGLTETMSDRVLRAELDLTIVTQPNDHLDYDMLVVKQVFVIGPPRDPPAQARPADACRVRSPARGDRSAQPQSVSAARSFLDPRREQRVAETRGGFGARLWAAAVLRHS